MARIVRAGEAKDLGLRGRVSKEIISGANGSDSVTLRLVEIPISAPDDPPRKPHSHSDCEECIHVLSGRGVFCTDDGEQKVGPGDTVLVPPRELHFMRNAGGSPLLLLCFFPVSDLQSHG